MKIILTTLLNHFKSNLVSYLKGTNFRRNESVHSPNYMYLYHEQFLDSNCNKYIQVTSNLVENNAATTSPYKNW